MRYMLVFLMALAAAGIFADEVVAGRELSHAEGLVQDMSSKLNRGIVNILTGWCEIPRQMMITGKEKSGWLVIPVGIPAGAIMTVVRTATGVFETGLFFVPIDDSYGPILDPGYVWQKSKEQKRRAEKQ
ncbi:MAG: exosortase system-associated protein, TIGR04073 family [Kiritimatiellales bacterium]